MVRFCSFAPGDDDWRTDNYNVEENSGPLWVVDQEQAQEVEEHNGPLAVILKKRDKQIFLTLFYL